MTRSLIFVLAAVVVFLIAMSGKDVCAQEPVQKIGVLIWANEARYEDSAEGFIEQLKREGFVPPKVDFVIHRAKGSRVTAVRIAEEFAAQPFDLYFATGTNSLSVISKIIKDQPIVFSTVYDPLEAGLIQGWSSSGNNLAGASNNAPMKGVLELLQQIAPLKTVAVLYTPYERNSEAQLKSLQQYQLELGVNIMPVPIMHESEVTKALPFLEGKAQGIFVTGSIVVASRLSEIMFFAAQKKMVTGTHLSDLVDKGVMVGLSADMKEQGVMAGEIAAKILRGARPSDLPIERPRVLSIIINKKAAQSAGIVIPEEVLKKAVRIIE